MRIVFVNMHGNEMLLKTMDKYVFKHSSAIKHKYFLDYLLQNPDVEVCSYLNDRGFSLIHNGNKALLSIINLFKFAEHRYVLKKNKIESSKVKTMKSIQDIRNDDIVIVYRHHIEQLRYLENVEAFKAVSMIHFWGRKDEAKIIEKVSIDCMVNESNLQKNSEIFRRYYTFDGEWIVHPFVYEERFQVKTEFSKRKKLAFATGTITYRDIADFVDVYGDTCNQPSRKQIMDNSEYLEGLVDCYSSDYNEDSMFLKYEPDDNAIVHFYKKFYNRINTGQQKKYYSFDMVEKFNEYKMCIVGEEVIGIPGIGFVEGMACGCAYIGLVSSMYEDLGLYPGIHYIGYDGSLEGLKQVVQYYQMDENQEELAQIAKTGCEYVRKKFAGDIVAKNLLEDLIDAQKKWASNR